MREGYLLLDDLSVGLQITHLVEVAVADLEVSRLETIPVESIVGVSHGSRFRLTFVKLGHAVVVHFEVHLC